MNDLDRMKRENDEAARRELADKPKPLTKAERETNLELMVNGLILPELPTPIPPPYCLTAEDLDNESVMSLIPIWADLDLPSDYIPEGYFVQAKMCVSQSIPPMFRDDKLMGTRMFAGSLRKSTQESTIEGFHPAYAITCACEHAIEITAFMPNEEAEAVAEFSEHYNDNDQPDLNDILGGLLDMPGFDTD